MYRREIGQETIPGTSTGSQMMSKWEYTDTEHLRTQFRCNYPHMSTHLTREDIRAVASKLFSHGMMTTSDLEQLHLKSTTMEATTNLLDFVLRQDKRELYCAFLNILQYDLNHLDIVQRFDVPGNLRKAIEKRTSKPSHQLEELDLSGSIVSDGTIEQIGRLQQLNRLKLSNCSLTYVPKLIGDMTMLEVLDLSGNNLSFGNSQAIGQLKRLKRLKLANCALTALPEAIMNLEQLEELDISGNNIGDSLKDAICQLWQLKRLMARHCKLTALPDKLEYLKLLKELDLTGNNFSGDVNPTIGRLSGIKILKLQLCGVTTLPDTLVNLQSLELLDLSGNNFSDDLGKTVGRLSRLRKLRLVHCELSGIPKWFGNIGQLEELNLSRNNFSNGLELATQPIFRLKKLVLIGCELTTVSGWLEEQDQLEELNLSRNSFSYGLELATQPKFRLKKLLLIGCELKSVPGWLGEQDQLEELNLSRNSFSCGLELATQPIFRLKKLLLIGCELTSVPGWLGEQGQLEELNLSRNNFSNGLELANRPIFRLKKLLLIGCQLKSLPGWLGEQEQIIEVNITGNSISESILQALPKLYYVKQSAHVSYDEQQPWNSSDKKDSKCNSETTLYGQLSEIMLTVSCEIGISSYFFYSRKCKLVVHPRNTRDIDMLEGCLQNLIKEHDLEDIVETEIAEKPIFAEFSYCVEDSQSVSNVGMYVTENDTENYTVYWLSTAHGLVKPNLRKLFSDSSASKELHVGNIGPLFLSNLSKKFKLPTPYACFSQPRDDQYMVDIMVGPMILFKSNIPPFTTLFHPKMNPSAPTEWQRASIMDLPGETELSEALNKKIPYKLVGYSWKNAKVLEGFVSCCGAITFYTPDLRKVEPPENDKLSTFMFIKSLNGAVPEVGDSGSVWFIWTADNKFEAVAITNAIIAEAGYWGATPLSHSLKSLRSMYPNVFPDSKQFVGYGLYVPRNYESLCKIEF